MGLSEWYRRGENSVTRERIFFHKLYFDLKLAGARRGYALTLFEPEVDRDAYDIVLDDGDGQRRVQLKSVVSTGKTNHWGSTKRFMRLEAAYGDQIGMAPADCGIGGAFVVIVIDDTDDEGKVQYLYTDYYLIEALGFRLVREKKPRKGLKSFGRDALDRVDFATRFLKAVHQGSSRDKIDLDRKLFLRAANADALLALLGLHSTANAAPISDLVMRAITSGFRLMNDGSVDPNVSLEARAIADYAGHEILRLMHEPLFEAYGR